MFMVFSGVISGMDITMEVALMECCDEEFAAELNNLHEFIEICDMTTAGFTGNSTSTFFWL